MPRSPQRPPALLGQPFRGSAAIGAGLLTGRQLRSSAWRRLFRDVYVDAVQPDSHLLRIQAAALILPAGAVIAGRSAAHLWGCEFAAPDDPVETLLAGPARPPNGIRYRYGRIAPADMATNRGVPVGTPIWTAWDIARSLPLDDAIGWVDAFARHRRLDPRDLRTFAECHRSEPFSCRALATLRMCDPRAESMPESRLRVGLAGCGLPPTVPQFVVLDAAGNFRARVDLAWPAWRFAIEYDGRAHATRLEEDRRRIRGLNAAGWYVYPVVASDMYDMPRLAAAITAALTAWRGR